MKMYKDEYIKAEYKRYSIPLGDNTFGAEIYRTVYFKVSGIFLKSGTVWFFGIGVEFPIDNEHPTFIPSKICKTTAEIEIISKEGFIEKVKEFKKELGSRDVFIPEDNKSGYEYLLKIAGS